MNIITNIKQIKTEENINENEQPMKEKDIIVTETKKKLKLVENPEQKGEIKSEIKEPEKIEIIQITKEKKTRRINY